VSARVLVTGALGGIGAETMRQLRERGARVVGLDLHGDGGDVLACDVRDQTAVDRAVADAVQRLGGLDVLVNNAGVGDPQSAGEAPDERALAVLDINLVGPWRVTSAALPALREARGRVVNVSSGLAFLALPFGTAYCMSKRGLVAYSDALRLEHGDAISVTTVYPGYIRTQIHAASQAAGFGLEGLVPVEQVEDAAATIVRASLDPKPARDMATTRGGAVNYTLARYSPRRMVDRVVRARMRRVARQGRFAESGLAGDYVQRMRA
jgi:NAD(P)-dependent dehydrogenase (short-subunit alcohol dehydrogenase family)